MRPAWLLPLLSLNLLGCTDTKGPKPDEARQPTGVSILLVTTDTTRYDHLGINGDPRASTPTLDAFGASGIVLDRATSVAPITLVAHTSIHTGMYPPQTGVRNNGTQHVRPELTTLAEIFQARGYRTAAFVSAAVLERRYGLDQGFEVYDDDLSTGRERFPRMVPDRPAEATVDAALAWLDRLKPEEHFFLWTHFYDPHAPYSPPPPFRDQYQDDLYRGEIAYLDSQLARLLQHPRLRDRDSTAISILADHGESLGDHGEQTHAILVYGSTLHIPWLMRLPSKTPLGLRVRAPVSQVDLAPTLLEIAGLPSQPQMAGRSLLPLFAPGHDWEPHALYSETYLPFYTYGWAKLRAITLGNWKYIDAPRPELYDLEKDPRELTNVEGQYPGMAHDLQRDLREMLDSFGNPDYENSLAIDSEAEERLRNLGYIAAGHVPSPQNGQRPDPKDNIDLHVSLERARTLLSQRLFQPAIAVLKKVLARDPGNLSALSDLADAYEQAGNLDAAVETARKALELDPTSIPMYLTLSGLESGRGSKEEALALLDSALKLDPHSFEVSLRKAYLLRQLQRLPEMELLLDRALEELPEDARLNAAHAQLVEMPEGKLDLAERRIRKALERDPFLLLGWRLLAEVLEREGRAADAADACREGLKRRSDDDDLHAKLGMNLARRGLASEASMHLEEALRLSDHFRDDVHLALGALLAENGRFDEAMTHYDAILKRNPEHPGARNNRAVAYYRTGRLDDARIELLALTREYPDQKDAWNNLAAIAVDQDKLEDAETYARSALKLDEHLVEAWNNLGIALGSHGQDEEARSDFEKALSLDSTYWPARNNLALTLKKQGRAQEAAVMFEEVLKQVPNQVEAHLAVGDLYMDNLGEPRQAKAHYLAALQLSPKHPRLEEIRQRLLSLEPGAP